MTYSVSVSICGEAGRPACLALAELRSLMDDAELVAGFHCREGWSRLGGRWRAVRLVTLLGPGWRGRHGGLDLGRRSVRRPR